MRDSLWRAIAGIFLSGDMASGQLFLSNSRLNFQVDDEPESIYVYVMKKRITHRLMSVLVQDDIAEGAKE